MADIVDKATRSRMMSGIRGKNTKPELLVRRGLHRLGLRYRLHQKDLPGKPDIVLKQHHAVVFVHGCFWHRHDCAFFKWPRSKEDWWRAKIEASCARDSRHVQDLMAAGWRIGTVWECALRKKPPGIDAVNARLAKWIRGSSSSIEISG